MSKYILHIQTEDLLINESIEDDDIMAALERCTTLGIHLKHQSGESGKWIPGHSIKNIKWEKAK